MSIENQLQESLPQPVILDHNQNQSFDVESATSKRSMQHSLVGPAGHLALLGKTKEFGKETAIKSID